MQPLYHDAFRGGGEVGAPPYPRWGRLRTGSSVGHLPGSVASPHRRLGPALLRLEPSSGLIVWLLLPCVLLLLFLKGLSGSFRQSCTPAMACPPPRLLGVRPALGGRRPVVLHK